MKTEILLDKVTIGGRAHELDALPKGYHVDMDLGLVIHDNMSGQLVHTARWPERGLFETRATKTPKGDYLLMFPDGGHYGGNKTKVNDMLAYRSSDKGKTWQGPTVAFDIDYNQHGFVPLIPRGGTRIYAFGTQPTWGLWTQEHGLGENAPIGYRCSDDDGRHWSEVRIIRPKNDPNFRGMSVQPMCETDAGTWLIGAHEGDWSYKPLITRQYILRSEDRGATWEVVPGPRHGGWHCPGFGRMDELQLVNLGGGKVLALARTPEGHIWELRSGDDGKTWTDPKPTSLVHPDAPPMLFHLSDGKTLACFHHNRHAQTNYIGLTPGMEGQKDRSEIWVSISKDDGISWSPPRFVLANAMAPKRNVAWWDYQCSYMGAVSDGGVIHLFVPHRWERVLHLELPEHALASLAAQDDLRR